MLPYFTHTRLMRESESSVQNHAALGIDPTRRVCSQLIACEPRYLTWLSGHDRRMWHVAEDRQRERQILGLRLVATQQVHRAALVRYLRENMISGPRRDRLLKEFYGTLDIECAVLAEHRGYTQAVSSQLCAVDLLEMCNDHYGAAMIGHYEREYGTFFAIYCDRVRALSEGRPYLLASLMPEVRARAQNLRRKIVSGDRLPPERLNIRLPAGRSGARGSRGQPGGRQK